MDALSLSQLARRAEHVISKHERMWLAGAPAAAPATTSAAAACAPFPLAPVVSAAADEPASALSHALAALHTPATPSSPSSPATPLFSPTVTSGGNGGSPSRRSALTAELQKAGLARLQPSPLAG
ncbi:hypothetical protein ABPG75_004116 [Micractinium tetrahymenae]